MGRVFVHRLRVRYGECDPQGIVFNANYMAFFDVAMTELWRAIGCEYREMVERGADMVVAESSLRFLAPARFDDDVDLEVRVRRLGESAMETSIDGIVAGTPVVAGRMRHVFVDPVTHRKRSIPNDVRAALEPYLTEDAGASAEGTAGAEDGAGDGAPAPAATAGHGDVPPR